MIKENQQTVALFGFLFLLAPNISSAILCKNPPSFLLDKGILLWEFLEGFLIVSLMGGKIVFLSKNPEAIDPLRALDVPGTLF